MDPKDPDGHLANECWPDKIARDDPGFTLLSYDPYYTNKKKPYNFEKPYKWRLKPTAKSPNNGSPPTKRSLGLSDGNPMLNETALLTGELYDDEYNLEEDGGELGGLEDGIQDLKHRQVT